MRPHTLDDVIGQEHLTGEGAPFRKLIDHDAAMSVVLWGPPGTGKTTLAHVVSELVDTMRLCEDLGRVVHDAADRRELGRCAAELDGLWALTKRNVSQSARGVTGPGALVIKLAYTELRQRFGELCLRVLGPDGLHVDDNELVSAMCAAILGDDQGRNPIGVMAAHKLIGGREQPEILDQRRRPLVQPHPHAAPARRPSLPWREGPLPRSRAATLLRPLFFPRRILRRPAHR